MAALLSLGILLAAPHAAADEYWDGTITEGSGLPNGKGGDGTWDASSANWVDASGNNPHTYDPTELTVFSTIGGSVFVQGNLSFTALRFDVDHYVINSGASGKDEATLAPTGIATITGQTAGTDSILNVNLVGSGGISIAGPGAISLAGNTPIPAALR